MDDLISRQAAIDTALRAISDLQGKDSIRDEYIISEMEEIPSTERHGRWIDLHCSVCGKIGWMDEDNYCPNCGAKMDLEGEEEC